ncbi:hypothetical protein ACLUWO_05035 [Pseudoscardovia radai]|uniref:hypothetical protein n=1 Tax=Pseudoscardovia radai TaxID=987066 RepID=UPI0039918003
MTVADGMSFDPKEHPRDPHTGEFSRKGGAEPPDAGYEPPEAMRPEPRDLCDVHLIADRDTGDIHFEDQNGEELFYCYDCDKFHYVADVDPEKHRDAALMHELAPGYRRHWDDYRDDYFPIEVNGETKMMEGMDAREVTMQQDINDVCEWCGLRDDSDYKHIDSVRPAEWSELHPDTPVPSDKELEREGFVRLKLPYREHVIPKKWATPRMKERLEREDAIAEEIKYDEEHRDDDRYDGDDGWA